MNFKQVDNFYNFLNKAKSNSKFGEFLSLENENYYNDKLNYIANNGEIGFSINGKGYITSVFNNSKEKNVIEKIMNFAKSLDYKRLQLDCFDGKLKELYSKQGFKVIERIKFNKKYAPKGWNYDKYGTPDVLIMEYVNQ